ncbi:MAG: STAS/SEC14 domain-containing protein [Pseudanabaena frigida]|uniref:STAS/SEC14 domain-containing protein n=1 Tax=Pseudanabaena frigida TaxID=945775 RepID=A0A2W4YCB4_9CYAN|nr:MAG: STAS/SEC14 domain-containing protein [Pseudanabaena frigida]
MATVQFKSEISIELDQLLTGVAQLDTPDLEKLLIQVRQVLAHRQNPSLPALELELLQKINQAIPEEIQQKYNDLSAKMRSQTITPEEHQDLLKLIDIVEKADCDRLQHLIQLSQLRNISLAELMKQLQIHPQPVHV